MSVRIVESYGDVELGRGEMILVSKLDSALAALDAKQAEFAEYLNELKAREEEVKELKEKIYAKMSEEGVKKLENDHLIITAVSPSNRHTLDTTKMKAVDPALFARLDKDYGKDTTVKGYAKITVKGR